MPCVNCGNTIGFALGTCVECGWNENSGEYAFIKVQVSRIGHLDFELVAALVNAHDRSYKHRREAIAKEKADKEDALLSGEERQAKRAAAPCPKSSNGQHKWGTDGQHQNEFCKHCYVLSPTELVKRDKVWPTAVLREELAKNKIANPEAYEWFDGEPLYRGDPIQGRSTPAEHKAFDATIKRLAEGRR